MHVSTPQALFVVGMAAAAAFDLRSRRVPNWLTVSIAVVGLGVRGTSAGLVDGVLMGLAGAALGLGLLFAPFALRWLGAGDVKLAAAIGAWLGPVGVLYATVWGVAVGGAMGLLWMATRRTLRTEVVTNLQVALLTRSLPDVAPRRRAHMVPLAVALGAAAVGVLFYEGIHG